MSAGVSDPSCGSLVPLVHVVVSSSLSNPSPSMSSSSSSAMPSLSSS